MTDNIGWASLEIIPSLRGFEGKVRSGTDRALTTAGTSGGERFGTGFASKASSSIHRKLSDSAKYIVGPLIAAFAVERVGEFIGDSIRGAIDDQGAENRANLVFGRMSKRVGEFSDNAAQTYGLADSEARSAASGFGILFKQTDLSAKAGAKASVNMVKLGADLAAFAHIQPDKAFTALQRGLQGSTRGLKPFGILIDSAQQKAEALRLGLLKPVKDQAKIHSAQASVLKDQADYNAIVEKSGKGSIEAQVQQAKLGAAQENLRRSVEGSVPALTAQQKILANQSLILSQTTTQQGQFGRSSGDLLTEQKRLAAGIDNAKDRIGKGLLPITTDLVHFLNEKAVPAVTDFSDWFEKDGSKAIGGFIDDVRPLGRSLLPAIATGFGDVAGFLKDAAPYAKKTIDAFNSLPDWAQKTIVLGAGAGLLAKKTGALSVGRSLLSGGGVGGVVSMARPLPVVVTNPGFGGKGGPGGGVLTTTERTAAAAEGGSLAARASAAARAAAAAAKAEGAGVAAQSSAAARAFKAAIADSAATSEAAAARAFKFGSIAGGGGILRTLLGAPLPALGSQAGSHSVTGGSAPNVGSQFVIPANGKLPGLAALNAAAADTGSKVDAIRAKLGQASQGFDLVGTSGKRNLAALQSRTDTYASTLRHIPERLQTKLDIDTTDARRQVDAVRAYAGRHIPVQLSIELPSRAALDGVRRP